MKKPLSKFDSIIETLPQEQQELVDSFFMDLSTKVILVPSEKHKLFADFQNIIIYYLKAGLTLDAALNRIDVANLGGFYSRMPSRWFALDYSAKIYPLSMGHGQMSVFRLSVYLKKDVVPEVLQMALTFTIKRFPQFATTLKKGLLLALS